MVKTQTEYDESKIQINEPQYLMRKLKNMQKGIAVIQKQIEAYGLITGQEGILEMVRIQCYVYEKKNRS